jgi:hypothetical protein
MKMMKYKNKIMLVVLFVVGMLYLPSFSYSASEIEVEESDISVEIMPENPEPYQNVTIKIYSYSTDLNKAMIEWRSGSNMILSGFGKTSYSYKAEGANTTTAFEVMITPVGSVNKIIKQIVVSPSEVEIMWESVDGYTPPFYKGKSLPVSGSTIRAVAIPNTNTIKAGKGSITYTWKDGDKTSLASSGYNKDAHVFKNSMFDEESEITVVASSLRGDYEATKSISVPIYKPKIIFYKRSLTEGILYNNALNKEISMAEDEMTIVSEPYFLSTMGNENAFTYNWKINGGAIETPSKKTELTIRPTSRGGYATINISIDSVNELFQKVSNQLKINL